MRVFLFISHTGISWPIADRVQKEGHRVLFYINHKAYRIIGNGIVEKHDIQDILINEEGSLNQFVLDSLLHPIPDCIIFDMVGHGYGKAADILRKKGFPVIGGSEWQDRVEADKPFGLKVMKTLGIDTPEFIYFNDTSKAIQHVKESNKNYTFKPGNQVYVSRGPDDLIGMLEFYSRDSEFQLQERKDGIEISSEIWFNGKEIINYNLAMEEKALMEGNKGPKVGGMGSVVWEGEQQSRLFKEGIGRLIPLLKKIRYTGPLGLSAVVDKDNLWGMELTARFSHSIYVFLEMFRGRVNDLLYSVATGVAKKLGFKSTIGMGIALMLLPKDTLVQGLTPQNLKHFWGDDMYLKDNHYITSGRVGTVTAIGENIDGFSPLRDAKRKIMRTINNLIIPDIMYRSDIGDRVEKERRQLKDWGWL